MMLSAGQCFDNCSGSEIYRDCVCQSAGESSTGGIYTETILQSGDGHETTE
ncbi:hypothetical protein SAMN05421752_103104 [Natronorubrum thiooxidans]|uniref:Uncharacterized protein n=1 Tax=Natronorubrum thiooxidans TaxID=308853 RepID=A0A1N7E0W6_9EURY|nr:hypothetical protein SAMN05421752_103104 [Natronorubrum thiooxidans]